MRYTVPQVWKAVLAFALTTVTVAGTIVADGTIELEEALGFVGAVVTAYGVFRARNAPT
jgi:hypothetical protein